MDWTVFWQGAITLFGTTAILLAALAWLTKTGIAHWLDKATQQHKATLEFQNAQAIESLRNSLKIQLLEHEVRFRRMHERQAEIIAEVFERLDELYHKFMEYLNSTIFLDEAEQSASFKQYVESGNRFNAVFYPRRLFLPNDTAHRIGAFIGKLKIISGKLERAIRKEAAGRGDEKDQWSQSQRELEQEAAPLFDEIHSEFQRLLGVRSTDSSSPANARNASMTNDTTGREGTRQAQS